MAKATTVTKTKTATKEANTKTKKADAGETRAFAYNTFVSTHLPKWNEENPGRKTEGMAAVRRCRYVGQAPENPNRGKPVVKRAPKEKKAKEPKADTKKTPKSKSKAKPKKKDESEEEEEEAEDEDEEKENEIQSSDD
ncbi:hypothetical protein B0H13DRAFT_2318535 [Mycena leptocephala]|nr:hypothetical protein B0H13DRAFT_2318535 [Mycena leptocephala]